MKKLLLALALIVLVAPAAFAEEALEIEDSGVEPPAVETVETVEAQPETQERVAEEDVLDSNGLPATTIAELETPTSSYACPWYTIYCRRDAQCDNYCGAPGAGACESGCCACLF